MGTLVTDGRQKVPDHTPGQTISLLIVGEARRRYALMLSQRKYWCWTQYVPLIPKGQVGGRVASWTKWQNSRRNGDTPDEALIKDMPSHGF